MQALIRAIEAASDKIGIFGALLIVPLVLSTCYEVFARYLFNSPTIWAYEVGYMLTGSHFLLGLAFTLRAGEHIRIDIFSGKFAARTRALIDLAGYAVLL
ncbi:MAG: TRAP transporter small permease subunit, partial [Betaproteobacteria bacterium]|nr:TRAP transporter small permease subunit [Betaproteobacteria bacterium]